MSTRAGGVQTTSSFFSFCFAFPLNRDLDDDANDDANDANDRRSLTRGNASNVVDERRCESLLSHQRCFGEAFFGGSLFSARGAYARVPLPFPFLLSVGFFSTQNLPTRLVSTRSKVVLTRVYFCVRENRSSAPASRAYRTL
jgi:hypothetical protein